MQIKWQDKTYDFEPSRDVTLSRMRQIKAWFPATGPYERGLSTYLRFIQAYGEGDPEALACVMWMMKTSAGEPTPQPIQMDDFPAGQFWNAIGTAVEAEMERLIAEAKAAEASDPLAVPLEDPSPLATPEQDVSTATPTNSEAATSASSLTSAI